MNLIFTPKYKYKICFEDYDCDEWNDGYEVTAHYTGGPYLALLEWDDDNQAWFEADRWPCEGIEFIEQIQNWEEDATSDL
jgi:hypothetical protein